MRSVTHIRIDLEREVAELKAQWRDAAAARLMRDFVNPALETCARYERAENNLFECLEEAERVSSL